MKTLKLIIIILVTIGFTSGCITIRTAMTKDGGVYAFRQRSAKFYTYRSKQCIQYNNLEMYKLTLKKTSPHEKYDFHPTLLVSIGRAYIGIGEIDKGIYFLERVLELQTASNDSSHLFALYNLGVVYTLYKNDYQQGTYYFNACITEGEEFIRVFRRNRAKSVYRFEQKDLGSAMKFKRITFVTKSPEHWIISQAKHRNKQLQNGDKFSFGTLETFVNEITPTSGQKDIGYMQYMKKPYGYKNRR